MKNEVSVDINGCRPDRQKCGTGVAVCYGSCRRIRELPYDTGVAVGYGKGTGRVREYGKVTGTVPERARTCLNVRKRAQTFSVQSYRIARIF